MGGALGHLVLRGGACEGEERKARSPSGLSFEVAIPDVSLSRAACYHLVTVSI